MDLFGFLKAVSFLNLKLLPIALHLVQAALANPQLLPDLKAAQADPAKLSIVLTDVIGILGIPTPTPTT